jgi:hypothetical protein
MPASDSTPTAKVAAGGLAASFVTVLVVASQDLFNYTMSAEVAMALVTIGGFVAAYFKRSRPTDVDV